MRAVLIRLPFKLFFKLFRAIWRVQLALMRSYFAARSKVAYFSFTRSTLHLPARIRPHMERRGVSDDSITYPSYGGGGYATIWKNFILDSEGHSGGVNEQCGAYTLQAGGGGGGVNLGYVINPRGRLRIYPMVGLGGGGLGAHAARSSPGSSNDGPQDYAAFGGGGSLLNMGLGIDWKIGGRMGLIIGVRLGYARSLLTLGSEMSSDPELQRGSLRKDFRMPFVHIIFGAGWFGRQDT